MACQNSECQCKEGHYDCDKDPSNGCESTDVCVCVPGEESPCYDGPAGTRGKGQCKDGVSKCNFSGLYYDNCEGATLPTRLSCNDEGVLNGLDNDCDGKIDTECVTPCEASLEPNSYIGCEYWAAYLKNGRQTNFTLIISNTGQEKAIVRIFDPQLSQTVEVEANSLKEVQLYTGSTKMLTTGLENRGVRLISTKPVTVYQFNPNANPTAYSNDASLLLPKNVLGKEYVSVNTQNGFGHTKPYIVIVNASLGDNEVSVWQAGSPESSTPDKYTLKPYDTLTIDTPNTIGMLVRSSQAAAVFAGDYGRNTGVCCWDHTEELLFPVRTWGSFYQMVKTHPLGVESHYWTIVAAKDNTYVKLSDPLASASKKLMAREAMFLKTKDYFDVESYGVDADNNPISGNYPITIAMTMPSAFETGAPEADRGDPSLMLVVPQAQYRNQYYFSVPAGYTKNWVTIVAPMTLKSVVLDNTNTPITLTGFGKKDAQGNYLAGYSYLELAGGAHTLSADEPIGVYGSGINQDVSYAYPLGLDLKTIYVN